MGASASEARLPEVMDRVLTDELSASLATLRRVAGPEASMVVCLLTVYHPELGAGALTGGYLGLDGGITDATDALVVERRTASEGERSRGKRDGPRTRTHKARRSKSVLSANATISRDTCSSGLPASFLAALIHRGSFAGRERDALERADRTRRPTRRPGAIPVRSSLVASRPHCVPSR